MENLTFIELSDTDFAKNNKKLVEDQKINQIFWELLSSSSENTWLGFLYDSKSLSFFSEKRQKQVFEMALRKTSFRFV